MKNNLNVKTFMSCIGNVNTRFARAELSRASVYERLKGMHTMAVAMFTLEELEEIDTIYREFLEFYSPRE